MVPLSTRMSARGVLLIWATVVSAHASAGAGYTGAAACAKCHAEIHAKWSQSRHSKMVQPATKTSVKGDFTRGKLQLRGAPYALRERDGVYYITESTLTGKPQEHRVDYTLGNRRIQHYLTTLSTGRVIVLAPSWDVLRKQWFHNFDIADPDETSEVLVQVWNKNCFSCHVSRQEKGYDNAKQRLPDVVAGFRHQLRALSRSGERARGALQRDRAPPKGPARDIVLQTRLDADAQHHGVRAVPLLPRHLRRWGSPRARTITTTSCRSWRPPSRWIRIRRTGRTGARADSPTTRSACGRASAT